MTNQEALEIVVGCALSYAGEIGFADPEYAMRLIEASKLLRPDMEY